jgi:signal transduction histidine kinase
MQILWVDDEPQNLRDVVKFLERSCEAKVDSAQDVTTAYRMAEIGNYDAIIVDVGMEVPAEGVPDALVRFAPRPHYAGLALYLCLESDFSSKYDGRLHLCTSHDEAFVRSLVPKETSLRILSKTQAIFNIRGFVDSIGTSVTSPDVETGDSDVSIGDDVLERERLLHDVKGYLLHALTITGNINVLTGAIHLSSDRSHDTITATQVEQLIREQLSAISELLDEYSGESSKVAVQLIDVVDEQMTTIKSLLNTGLQEHHAMIAFCATNIANACSRAKDRTATMIGLHAAVLLHLFNSIANIWLQKNLRAALELYEGVTRIDAIESGNFNPLVVLTAEVEAIRAVAAYERIDIRLECRRNLPSISGDWQLYKAAVRNILENALKFNGRLRNANAWITVRLFQEHDQIVTEVESWGSAIPEAERGNIFKPRYRGASAKAPGSGLGLNIAYEAAESLGGKIEIQGGEAAKPSERKNVVTKFRVLIPHLSTRPAV